ncbi:MAG TPA: hypothetical protein VJK54_08915, partial [Chthoniobacterales bacterium]|nr:hypothetical protein [Chthoniobacterales bacterium]
VNNLWQEVLSRYQQGNKNNESLQDQKTADYQVQLILNRNEMLKKFFQKISEITDSTKSSYYEVQQDALREYTEAAEQASLEAARAKVSGAAEAWAFRVSQAIQEVTQIRDELVNRGILSDCAQKLAEALVQIDKKAFEEFKKETERLANIEAIWVAKIEAHLKAAQIKREYAANSYAKGEAAAWNELTAEERSAYNNEVSDANNDHESQHTSKLKSAETALRQARYDLEEQVANKSHADELAIKNAHENVDKLEKEVSTLHTKKRIREEAVAWAKLTPGEREAEAAVSTTAKELWSSAEKAALLAKQTDDKINHNDLSAEGISLWNEALQRAVDAETAWVRIIEAYQRYYNQTLEENWKAWWSMKLKAAEDQKSFWSAKILYYQANKAQISATIAATVAEASFHEETLWDDAIQKAKDTVIAWEKTEAACQIGSNISFSEHSASDKDIDHQEVEYSKAQWSAHVISYQAKKIESSKMIALSKTNKVIDAGSLLKVIIQDASEVKQAYDRSIKFYEDSLSKIPERFKKQWKENLQDVKKGEEQWVPLTTCIEDIKKTADSPEGISARITAWMAAFKIADQQNISLESMIRNGKISRGTGSREALHQLESQKILWVSLKEKIFEEKVKYLLPKAEITEKEALVVHEKAMAALHQSEQESKGSAVTSINMDQLLDEACKKAKETEEDYGRIVEAFKSKGPENEEFKKVSHKKKVWVAYKSYYFAQKEARAARTFNTNEIQRTLQEERDVRDWDGMIARANAAKSAWQRASLLLDDADEINPGQFNLILQEANDEVHKNETDAYEYSLLKAEDDVAKGDLRDSVANFRESVAKSTTRAITSVRKSFVQVGKSLLNWTSGLQPGDMDRILTAKKAFVKAKKNWDSFSQAADRFMNEPNISNIEAAQFYTPLASYKKSNSTVSNDAALVKAMALVLGVDSESTDPVMVAFRRAYSARYNVREVVTNRFAKDIKNTIGISWGSKSVETPTERACKSAAEAEEAASKAANTIWADEVRWAASAARKAADFTKAVDQWKLSQGPLALQTEQTSL